MSTAYRNRIQEFKVTLSEENINLKTLRELCFNGIPFEGGIRALCWKILLNYLPLDQMLWESFLKKQREVYSQFLKEMIIQPGIAKANLGPFQRRRDNGGSSSESESRQQVEHLLQR
ncbi:TBC1 domain family member 13 [Larimichthys crocea]|uniref:Uncharacterized protein n=1 Tax=Larimichthys crocea TaxID=215358 RepID=A0ACD3QM15_LARCR|nr:TBC1 domain family member 13 [Larimichthys crocea]